MHTLASAVNYTSNEFLRCHHGKHAYCHLIALTIHWCDHFWTIVIAIVAQPIRKQHTHFPRSNGFVYNALFCTCVYTLQCILHIFFFARTGYDYEKQSAEVFVITENISIFLVFFPPFHFRN